MAKHCKQIGSSQPVAGAEGLATDLLVGAAAIAEFVLGDSDERRRIYWLAENGQLPVFRLGTILCARKSTILRDLASREAEVETAPAK